MLDMLGFYCMEFMPYGVFKRNSKLQFMLEYSLTFILTVICRSYTVYGKTFEWENFRGWNRKGSFTGKRSW